MLLSVGFSPKPTQGFGVYAKKTGDFFLFADHRDLSVLAQKAVVAFVTT